MLLHTRSILAFPRTHTVFVLSLKKKSLMVQFQNVFQSNSSTDFAAIFFHLQFNFVFHFAPLVLSFFAAFFCRSQQL